MAAPMNFVAFDVETANPDQSSICSVGFAWFENGEFRAQQEIRINPEDYFDPFHVSIHGIDASDVSDCPKWPEVFDKTAGILRDNIVVHHTHFDKVAFDRVLRKYEHPRLYPKWLDSARVARRTWEKCAYSGYGLSQLAAFLGIDFRHHDAAEDARASGCILLHAIATTGIKLEDWFKRVEQPLGWEKQERSRPTRTAFNGNQPVAETIVFTGALCRLRSECADLAQLSGFNVSPVVNSKTTILVLGDQDFRRLSGYEKSAKHRKAEKLSGQGQAIRIITEEDFFELLGVQ